MTLNQYIGKVKSGEYARPIAYLRGLIKAGKKDEADAYKKKLPLYVAGGVMEGGRKLEHMVRYSACMVIDIDDSPIPVLELLRRAAEFPYVKAGHVSPSGTGVKLFIRKNLKRSKSPLLTRSTRFRTFLRKRVLRHAAFELH